MSTSFPIDGRNTPRLWGTLGAGLIRSVVRRTYSDVRSGLLRTFAVGRQPAKSSHLRMDNNGLRFEGLR